CSPRWSISRPPPRRLRPARRPPETRRRRQRSPNRPAKGADTPEEETMKATMKSARRLLLQAAIAGGAAALALPAAAQQIELKLGHVGEPGSLYQIAAEDFAKRVQQKLGDKVKVVIFGSSQLGGDKEMLQKIKLGTLDLSIPSTVMSSEVDLFGMFEMPYLVK